MGSDRDRVDGLLPSVPSALDDDRDRTENRAPGHGLVYDRVRAHGDPLLY